MPHTPTPAEERVQRRFEAIAAYYAEFGDDDLMLHAIAVADELAKRGREPLRILTSNTPAHLAHVSAGADRASDATGQSKRQQEVAA